MSRGTIEQVYAVMKAIQYKPLKVTHICYKTHINCGVVKEYLEQLMEKGHVEKVDPHIKSHGNKIGKSNRQPLYRVTEKGRHLIEAMNIVSQVCS